MVKLYDISNWDEQSWLNTGGTRNKKVYRNPEDDSLYYFKQSFNKGNRNYKYEFWSEIIASEIGIELKFDILKYSIAIKNNEIGCISKSMILEETEELIEGGKYLQAFDTTFQPENNKLRSLYNFKLIIDSLFFFNQNKFTKDIIETIVFDALIGNSDRHQENWAIISNNSVNDSILAVSNEVKTTNFGDFPFFIKKIMRKIYSPNEKIRPIYQNIKLLLPEKTRFAPIYDSGCSFGRELDDSKIISFLKDKSLIETYIQKGVSEIHWENKKLTHFNLIVKLLETKQFKDLTLKILQRINELFDQKKIENIINSIDNSLNEKYNLFKLPSFRKEFTLELLILRYNKLQNLYNLYK